MKKFAALLLALMMVLPMVAMAEAVPSVSTDAFTSASVSNFYTQYAMTGDELMDACNDWYGEAQKATYLVCTTNPDGSPNAGVFSFLMPKMKTAALAEPSGLVVQMR